ncbi:hypothetical protein DOTSEDRAFT_39262 [Dothistroma septosporum NZE10]|uniref:Uncharacterized protein n=1 Tax=Dothistroma septosporum (strain NZE10 / CBS 128990) TaxID=675120 RepID=N1PBF3_DOTSN|nr:hypothetical protein DOTSEDRAFT_39262 [Dothistroma septosporum NZE10]
MGWDNRYLFASRDSLVQHIKKRHLHGDDTERLIVLHGYFSSLPPESVTRDSVLNRESSSEENNIDVLENADVLDNLDVFDNLDTHDTLNLNALDDLDTFDTPDTLDTLGTFDTPDPFDTFDTLGTLDTLDTLDSCQQTTFRVHRALHLHDDDMTLFCELLTLFLEEFSLVPDLIQARKSGQSIDVSKATKNFLLTSADILWPTRSTERGHLLADQNIMLRGDPTTTPPPDFKGPIADRDIKWTDSQRQEWMESNGGAEPTPDQEMMSSSLGVCIGTYMKALIDSWANGQEIPDVAHVSLGGWLAQLCSRKVSD